MMAERVARAGFAPSRLHRRCTAVAQLVATIALVLSLAVAGAAVSIGIARADGIISGKSTATHHLPCP